MVHLRYTWIKHNYINSVLLVTFNILLTFFFKQHNWAFTLILVLTIISYCVDVNMFCMCEALKLHVLHKTLNNNISQVFF